MFRPPTRSLALDGGLYVNEQDGTLVGYDSSGTKTGELETEAESAVILDIDPASGRLAAGVGLGNVAIINPETGEVQRLPGIRGVRSVGFARNGELLVHR